MADLQALEQTFQQWLHLQTLAPLHFVCGTIAANYMETDPVWGMLVGGPGWGKTELLNSTSQLPHVHAAATITEAALLSGTQRKSKAPGAKGGLLREIGDFGFLILKDFTSILSMNADLRGALLAALREIYDGAWTRHVGVDGGTKLSWAGKLAILAGCTGTIDGHHTVMSTMGERFLLYRFDHTDTDESAQANKALGLIGREKEMRQALASAMKTFFEGCSIPTQPTPLGKAEQDRLIALASLAARCRSAVERNGHSREITLVPDHEAPGRLALTLMRLLTGLHMTGVATDDAWTLCLKVGFDCMPKMRRDLLIYLIDNEDLGYLEGSTIADKLGFPTTSVTRTLEDLAAHHIIRRQGGSRGKSHEWAISDWAFHLYMKANGEEIRTLTD